MPAFTLVLFDDAVARGWEPFALSRPAGELLFGTLTLRARAEQVLRTRCSLQLAAEHLQGFEEAGAPAVAPLSAAPVAGDRLFLCSRALPAWGLRDAPPRLPARPAPLLIDGDVSGWWAPAGTPAPTPEWLAHPAPATRLAPIELPGSVLRHVWELVVRLPGQIALDVQALHPDAATPALPAGVHQFGSHPVVLGAGAQVEPGVVLDTRNGPIWLDEATEVRAFARLAGPLYLGPGSTILGGRLECVALGPVCKAHGELAHSVLLGYANKSHDGHIGHAYLGRWVNLGAFTTNSDLKNNYGTVELWTPAGEVDTGELKLGCLFGDHVKTAIGTLLNTGTVVGTGSNLFGAGMPPKYVPPFSWGVGAGAGRYRLDKFLEATERAMARRDVPLTPGLREQLAAAWRRSEPAG